MKPVPEFAALCQAFFAKRLMAQRRASQHTIAAYAQTFRLLVAYAEKRLRKSPSSLSLADVDAPFIADFLDHLESKRANSIRTRNARLAAIRSFYRYAALEVPQYAALIQRVLAIPGKRYGRRQIDYLTTAELIALLSTVDKSTWVGRRNHAMMLLAAQTGLRLSEITGLRRQDVTLGRGAHVRCEGKGRKERCTPLIKPTVGVLQSWLAEMREHNGTNFLFPNARGGRLSADAVQYTVANHAAAARKVCPSLVGKRVTPHVLRHTVAMELFQAGVDRSLIALLLGHESVDTTQVYLDSDLKSKEEALAKTRPFRAATGKVHLSDQLIRFLKSL